MRVPDSIAESSSDPSRVKQLASQEHIAGRIDVVRQRKRLVDRFNTERFCIAPIGDRHTFAADSDLTRIRRVRTGKNAHERTLARAITAHQANDFTWPQVDTHVINGDDRCHQHDTDDDVLRR